MLGDFFIVKRIKIVLTFRQAQDDKAFDLKFTCL